MYDIIIIGGGVNGCSIGRELSRYNLKTALLEKASDVCEGTSKANSGICHAGYDAKPGTLKAKLNVEGASMMEALSRELNFEYKKCGSYVLCFSKDDEDRLKELYDRGIKNQVSGLKIISGDEAREAEPNLSKEVVSVLSAESAAIIDPFGLTIAMAENAAYNGVEIRTDSEVTGIDKADFGFEIHLKNSDETIKTKMIINAAGVYADEIHNMVSEHKIKITPRRGEYMLLDTTLTGFVNKTVFQLPTALGKGILVTPTTHGNILVGPTASLTEDKEGTETTTEDLSMIKEKALMSLPSLPLREVITSFAGLRAHLSDSEDFLIEEADDAKGFIDVAGMESPGLSCAPATAKYVCELIKETGILELTEKSEYKIYDRKYARNFADASFEEKGRLIDENPLYKNVACRCKTVTEAQIVGAIHSIVPATTLDAVKRRTSASFGRCQAGFCNPKLVDILSRELNISPEEVRKNDIGSWVLIKEDE